MDPSESGQAGVQRLLSSVRYDLIPFDNFEEALTHVPEEAPVAITLAPELGIDRTVECATIAASRGHHTVPHIAPRFIADKEEVDEIATTLLEAGITDIFVPGGDRDEPVGELTSAYEMLVALDDLGHDFEDIGIAGYPEGHSFLDEETIARAIERKSPYATYLVTQLCFDAEAIGAWIAQTRDRGVTLPIEVGIPGVVTYTRLMAMSRKYGVARPLQFLRKTTGIWGFAREMIRSRGRYKPDELIDALGAYDRREGVDIERLRFYTFNHTEETESWRTDRFTTRTD